MPTRQRLSGCKKDAGLTLVAGRWWIAHGQPVVGTRHEQAGTGGGFIAGGSPTRPTRRLVPFRGSFSPPAIVRAGLPGLLHRLTRLLTLGRAAERVAARCSVLGPAWVRLKLVDEPPVPDTAVYSRLPAQREI
jgi:hypothetical protein